MTGSLSSVSLLLDVLGVTLLQIDVEYQKSSLCRNGKEPFWGTHVDLESMAHLRATRKPAIPFCLFSSM